MIINIVMIFPEEMPLAKIQLLSMASSSIKAVEYAVHRKANMTAG